VTRRATGLVSAIAFVMLSAHAIGGLEGSIVGPKGPPPRMQENGAVAQRGSATAHPDFSGYWELRFDSFNVPRAQLTMAAQAALERQRKKDLDAIRGCINIGMPAVMNDHATLDIRQSPTVIGIVAKSPSSTRYIYTDGRKHPDADELEPTTNGHTIGRWNGETLLVDTVGLNDRGITAIPGGGYRTTRSHLVEQYRLSGDGQQLLVTFTWTDAGVFRTPHSYAFRYYKVRSISEPRVINCIPHDADRTRFLTEAPAPVRF
jgi:hypothetical protein